MENREEIAATLRTAPTMWPIPVDPPMAMPCPECKQPWPEEPPNVCRTCGQPWPDDDPPVLLRRSIARAAATYLEGSQ